MRRLVLLTLLTVLSVGQLLAQSKTITGKVTDEKGNGVPNTSITVKGFKSGVTSETDGTFSIQVAPLAKFISVSAVGYTTTTISIVDKDDITIILQTEGKDLGTVTTGYKIIKKKDLTSSIMTVGGEVFQNKPIQSFDQALAGKAAGVSANITGGLLGDAVNIRIRGVNSISSSAHPLIIVDGVAINQNTNINTANSGNSTRYNPLADINPNDIESIDILKDASAAALYGSRAANGVIVITTKRGKNGTLNVGFNSFVSFNSATRLPKLLNGDNFTVIQNEKAANDGRAAIAKDIDINGDGRPDRTNWLDQVFRTGVSQNHQISLSGGTDKAKFYGSVDYTDQQGIVLGNRLRRGSSRINLDLVPQKWLKAGINLYYSRTQNNGVFSDRFLSGVTVSAYNAPPNVPVYNNTGELEGYYIDPNSKNLGNGNNNVTFRLNPFYNPVQRINLSRNDNNVDRFIGSFYGEVEPLKGLKLTSRFAVDYLQNFEDSYDHPNSPDLGNGFNGIVQQTLGTFNTWTWSNYATYTKKINDHSFSATAGVEYQYTKRFKVDIAQGNFADPYFKYIYDGLYSSIDPTGSPATLTGGDAFANAFSSYFGTLSYNFKNRYFIEGVLRADAFSGFGEASRTGYFPGGSVGWRIYEEDFMKNVKLVNDLKLRLSYGKVGNTNIESYASRNLYGGGQYADVNGLSLSQIGDPNLRWESSNKFDIGIDAAFLNNKINVTIDYFRNNITDLVLAAPVLRTVGLPNTGSAYTTNVGSMVNSGLELTINSTNVTNDNFTWKTSFNISFIKNKITKLIDKSDIISSIARASIGKQLGVFYLIRWAGVDPATGQAMFLDKDGITKRYNPSPAVATANKWTLMNGAVTTPITGNDAVYSNKSGYPTVFGGLDNTFSYKNFDLGVSLQYSLGNYVFNSTRAGLMTTFLNNNINEINTRWTKPGDVTNVQKLYLRDNISTQNSTRWLEKADFLRIREISLAYNFEDVKKRLSLNSLRIYASIQNAFLFTNYSGQDPEITTNRQNDPGVIANIANGIDNRGVPLARSITFGINVGF